MELPARTQAVTRTTFLAGGAALWASAIFGKLFYLQVLRHKHYAEAASEQQVEMVEIPAPRGSIFDRNLEILAMSEPVDSVYVSPVQVPNLAVAADILAPVLHLDRDQLYARLKSSYAALKRRGFCWVKQKITREEKAEIESLRHGRTPLPWIKLQADTLRHYPKLTAASHVVGSVDHAEKGDAGLELSLDSELRGEDGKEQKLHGGS